MRCDVVMRLMQGREALMKRLEKNMPKPASQVPGKRQSRIASMEELAAFFGQK